MYQELVANYTRDHLRSHLPALLEAVQDEFQDRYADGIVLQVPKHIETDNLVGGVYSTDVTKMPAYAIDIIEKNFSQETSEGLWLYSYSGHIAGVIAASSEVAANKIVKRHETATERFVKSHTILHGYDPQDADPTDQSDFRITGFGFVGAAYSGAEMIDNENNRETWIAGFRIDMLWIVSENGPDQHV